MQPSSSWSTSISHRRWHYRMRLSSVLTSVLALFSPGCLFDACWPIPRLKFKRAGDSSKLRAPSLPKMVHELRTPISSMLGMSALLQNTVLNTEQKDMVNTIQACSESLQVLIGNLLDLS